jgi:nucleotide-binding universal stress UspA family protein
LFQKILIPIDGSQLSLEAAKRGVYIAKRLESKVVFLYVIDVRLIETSSLTGTDPAILKTRLRIAAERYLNEATKLAEEENITFQDRIREGLPAEDILKEIEEEKIDLVIMGSKGMSGAHRVIIGSTAEEVVRWSPCPVLIVK